MNDTRTATTGALMSKQDYRRRARECLNFARISRDEEERSQMLIMASTLQRLAIERETKAAKTQKKDSQRSAIL
jgi:hypothetical protein